MGVAVYGRPGVTRRPLPWQWKVSTAGNSLCCLLQQEMNELAGLTLQHNTYSVNLSHSFTLAHESICSKSDWYLDMIRIYIHKVIWISGERTDTDKEVLYVTYITKNSFIGLNDYAASGSHQKRCVGGDGELGGGKETVPSTEKASEQRRWDCRKRLLLPPLFLLHLQAASGPMNIW